MLKKAVKLGGILCIIAFLTTLILSYVNGLTKDIIAENTQKAVESARQNLIGVSKFEMISDDIYEGKDENGNTAGYCVTVTSVGYGGDIEMIVGFYSDLSVRGIEIIRHSETPGLGAKSVKPEFSQSLDGKKPILSVVKNGEASESEFDAITGATITSKAIAEGINNAYEKLREESGQK